MIYSSKLCTIVYLSVRFCRRTRSEKEKKPRSLSNLSRTVLLHRYILLTTLALAVVIYYFLINVIVGTLIT